MHNLARICSSPLHENVPMACFGETLCIQFFFGAATSYSVFFSDVGLMHTHMSPLRGYLHMNVAVPMV